MALWEENIAFSIRRSSQVYYLTCHQKVKPQRDGDARTARSKASTESSSVKSVHHARHQQQRLQHALQQTWRNGGPRAEWGPLTFILWPPGDFHNLNRYDWLWLSLTLKVAAFIPCSLMALHVGQYQPAGVYIMYLRLVSGGQSHNQGSPTTSAHEELKMPWAKMDMGWLLSESLWLLMLTDNVLWPLPS